MMTGSHESVGACSGSVEFRLPVQAPTDSVPRGICSGSEERMTEYYPWVPEDGLQYYGKAIAIASFPSITGHVSFKTGMVIGMLECLFMGFHAWDLEERIFTR